MGFAVFHPEKGTGSGGGIGHHIDRTPGHEHTFAHVDPARKDQNINYALKNGMDKLSIPEGINKRIEEGYTGKKAIRKDAVKFLSLVMTGTHEDMKKLSQDPQAFKQWQKANYDFVAKEFGEQNILRFTLHMDEKTPHLHAIVVPLTQDGRLSAKELMGNKKTLSERQDRYAAQMEPFALSRGVVGSKARHTGEGWYLSQLKEAQESQNTASLPNFGFKAWLDPLKYESTVKTVVKGLQNEAFEIKLENRRRIEQVKQAQEGQKRAETAVVDHKEAIDKLALQLIQAGREGIKLDSSYALVQAPQALRQAATKIFEKEIDKLEKTFLMPSAEVGYRKYHRLEDSSKATKESYDELQKRDTPESRQQIAAQATAQFHQEIQNKWGVCLNTDSKDYKEYIKKALSYVQEAAKTVTQEVKKVLGLDPPVQQKKSRGIG